VQELIVKGKYQSSVICGFAALGICFSFCVISFTIYFIDFLSVKFRDDLCFNIRVPTQIIRANKKKTAAKVRMNIFTTVF